jgi:hypothetical protein
MSPFWQRRSWTLFQRVLIYGAATVLALLALRWLYVFVLTDYRSHRRPVMIPVAVVALLLAFGLFRLSSAAVALLVVLAVFIGAGALYFQIAAAFIQPFLSALVAGSALCLCALLPRLIKSV